MTYYTTITSKGQITLPAVLRRKLQLGAGQRVSVSLGYNNQLVIESPPDITAVRQALQADLKKRGFTTAKLRKLAEEYQNGDGMAAHVQEKYGR